MQPRFTVGLIVGVVGLILNVCVSAAVGVCGPAVSLIAGAVAGYFAARQENQPTKSAGAQAGAISGATAGALIIIGQVIGGITALVLMQTTGMSTPFGQIPATDADASAQITFYLTGAATGCCFGLVGAVLAALAGAGTGYLGTSEQTPVPDM